MVLIMPLWAQDLTYLEVEGDVQEFAIDANGNIFATDATNTLYKFDASGKLITKVNVKVYGVIQKIDCNNPFDIYTYHNEQNVVVYYDNMLNIRGETRLNDLLFTGVVAMARSFDNQLWVADNSTNRLYKVSKAGEVLIESNILSTMVEGSTDIVDIQEYNNIVYVVDRNHGILEFDLFLTFQSLHVIPNLQWAVIGEQTILLGHEKWYMYNHLTRILSPIKIPTFPVDRFVRNGYRIFVKHKDGILSLTAD